MKMVRIATVIGITTATLIAFACSVDVSIAGKQCPCSEPEYVCDDSTNTCLTPAELAAKDSGVVILADGNAVLPDAVPPPCLDETCPCTKDDECLDPLRPKCDPDKKLCFACLRGPVDTCPAGQFCTDQNVCTLGCKLESDCQITTAAPHCDTVKHKCVECQNAGQCGDAGLLCSPSGTCVAGCNIEAGIGCAGTALCCGGFCLDTSADEENCGTCNNKCSTNNNTPQCIAGTCAFPNCAAGYAHCAAGNTGCETHTAIDETKCGNCTTNCFGLVKNAVDIHCIQSACTYLTNVGEVGCKAGFWDQNMDKRDGCEATCGTTIGEVCCPGDKCFFVGGKCTGSAPSTCKP